MIKTIATFNVPVFNPLAHGIKGESLKVDAATFNLLADISHNMAEILRHQLDQNLSNEDQMLNAMVSSL